MKKRVYLKFNYFLLWNFKKSIQLFIFRIMVIGRMIGLVNFMALIDPLTEDINLSWQVVDAWCEVCLADSAVQLSNFFCWVSILRFHLYFNFHLQFNFNALTVIAEWTIKDLVKFFCCFFWLNFSTFFSCHFIIINLFFYYFLLKLTIKS